MWGPLVSLVWGVGVKAPACASGAPAAPEGAESAQPTSVLSDAICEQWQVAVQGGTLGLKVAGKVVRGCTEILTSLFNKGGA
eukprot:1153215-Pelagomonas_calceolata.AAC.11